MYYKIPPYYVEQHGLATTFVKFPDGNFLVPRAFMARIDPDIDAALEKSGGIAMSLDEARDEQLGLVEHPLPSQEAEDGNADSGEGDGEITRDDEPGEVAES